MSDDLDQADREAILARRKHFVTRTLDGLGALRGDAAQQAGRRTKAVVLAVGSLAIACPCLDVAPPDTGEPEEGPTPDMPMDTTETGDTETGDTETGATETGATETGATETGAALPESS